MRKFFHVTLGCLAFLVSACSSGGDILIDDFESGTFDKWTVEGNAFVSPALRNQEQERENTLGGKYLADSFGGDDNLFGTLTSGEFAIERNYINFLIGGGKSENMYIELLIDGVSVVQSYSLITSGELNWVTWDVKAYKGQKAQIRIVDNESGGWGHFMIDEISQGNKQKSTVVTDYELTFDIESKYLLIPIEDDGSESEIQLAVNSEKRGVPMHIRMAQTKTDYWVPVDVSSYVGQKISLTFSFIEKANMGLSQIKQSETFDFDYNEPYRPLFHASPKHGWMNDPNGMVYHNGEYHLFFQYNPYGSRWANMHWGHFVSKDMTNWEMLPIAIAPDSIGSIFSGSAVIDKDNTAGFGKDAMIAIYTSAGKTQVQSIAYSLDNGRTFIKYEHNPVLIDANYSDFRDPKVFWHVASKQWIMTLATGQTISFYGSKNLKEWNKLSEFGNGIGAHGGVWECPDLFYLPPVGEMKGAWVLLVSINPGGPNGGSATQYFIGNFDGKSFKADNLPYPLWLDYGRDNYAGVTWSNVPEQDGRTLFIGWMNNWDYANFIPQTNFRSSMTIVRELKLLHNGKHLLVGSYPVKETESLRGEHNVFETIKVNQSKSIDNLIKDNTRAYEVVMTLKSENSSKFSFALTNNKGEEISFFFNKPMAEFSVDRSKSGLVGFSEKFASNLSLAPLHKKDSYNVRLFVDKSSVECFIDGGEIVQTNTIFSSETYNSIRFVSDSEISIENLSIYQLDNQE